MEILIKASQLILSLSLLIVLHELGHFLPARWFKIRVEKFYLFFDPKFSLFKRKIGETEYGIGWLPFGGYVKIAGMIDESLDKEQLKQPPQSWEFRSKPAWQRLIVMLGGVTVNLILGILIYIGILFFSGEEYLATRNLKYGVACDSTALAMGLRDGDRVVSVDHKPVDNFNKVAMELLLSDTRSIEVDREGQVLSIPVNTATLAKIIQKPSDLLSPRFPFEVAELLPDGAGKKAGILPGDLFVSVNGSPTPYFHDVRNALQKNKGKQVQITLLRKGVPTILAARVPETGKLGLAPQPIEKYMPLTVKKYSFLEAIPAGTTKAFTTLSDYLRQFKLIFNSEVKGYESVGGFITFGKVFSPEWDWLRFWNLTAFFSIVLAIMNVLPIPALDGGHVLFLLYEMITGRKPHEKVMEYAQLAGMILVFGLVIYANANDVVKLFAR